MSEGERSNYNYSQLHDIIQKQYAKAKSKSGAYDNWFLEETFKFGKGYVKPSNYLSTIANKIVETSKRLDSSGDKIDEPLYLHI
jgi:hypothetical protein